MNQLEPPFRRKAFFDDPALAGARWWHEALVSDANAAGRRKVLQTLGLGAAAVVLLGGMGTCAMSSSCCCKSPPSDDDPKNLEAVKKESLSTQMELGWDVGASDKELVWNDASPTDADGQIVFPTLELPKLAVDLRPRQTRLIPFYGQVLFSVGTSPMGASIAQSAKAIRSSLMDAAFLRGRAIASLLSEGPNDIAVILDLPGPESVAASAGMAERFEPVYVFDNWPHPAGVVPSHLTLGSALFFKESLTRAAGARRDTAPPVFCLDANRLLPYTDEATQFDNRYMARLPPWSKFKELGYKRVLYVRPDAERLVELDDLNRDFNDAAVEEVEVKACAMTDFQPAEQGDAGAGDASASAVRDAGIKVGIDAGRLPDGGIGLGTAIALGAIPVALAGFAYYYYAGAPRHSPWFWRDYGWGSPPPPMRGERPGLLSGAPSRRFSLRPTIFTGVLRGAASRPDGFGLVTLNKNRQTGSVVSMGRSGSLGRIGGSSGSSSTYRGGSTSGG